jgi:hypothetical protein
MEYPGFVVLGAQLHAKERISTTEWGRLYNVYGQGIVLSDRLP